MFGPVRVKVCSEVSLASGSSSILEPDNLFVHFGWQSGLLR